MEWRDAAHRELFESRAEEELKAALLRWLPVFKAPTRARAWTARAARLRGQALDRVFLRGYPRDVVTRKPKIVWGDVLQVDKTYVIRKVRYEAYPDYWIPALLYEPVGLKGRVPVVLNPIGHFSAGKVNEDQQIRCANLARRGLLALNVEFVGMGELVGDAYHHRLAHLNLAGMAGPGFMYLALKKGLDVLLAHRHADRRRVAVTGLSGGGWQTIVISALDRRVTLSAPVAGYTSMRARVGVPADIGDLEQAPVDMTTVE